MEQYIPKAAVVAEIERLKNTSLEYGYNTMQKILADSGKDLSLGQLQYFLDTLGVKEVDLLIHTIIAECCDWLATHTNLSHDEIEGCRNLMLTVKDESLKAQKGE